MNFKIKDFELLKMLSKPKDDELLNEITALGKVNKSIKKNLLEKIKYFEDILNRGDFDQERSKYKTSDYEIKDYINENYITHFEIYYGEVYGFKNYKIQCYLYNNEKLIEKSESLSMFEMFIILFMIKDFLHRVFVTANANLDLTEGNYEENSNSGQ